MYNSIQILCGTQQPDKRDCFISQDVESLRIGWVYRLMWLVARFLHVTFSAILGQD